MSALRTLALTLGDVAAAEAYARSHLAPAEYRTLLHLVLEPGPGGWVGWVALAWVGVGWVVV